MRAVRLHGIGDLRVEDVLPPGAPEPGWARLKVLAAGICGSDLHNFRTGQWISRTPSTPGHELAGEVTAIEADAEELAIGDHVVADSRFWCGMCAAWSRWCEYVASGHGGNVELRALVSDPTLDYCRTNFRFALLETAQAGRRMKPSFPARLFGSAYC